MGFIIRHAGSPYIDGENLPAKDLETDFARAYAEIAGNMNNDNVRADADIAGSKLAGASLPGSKITDNVMTTVKIQDNAVVGEKFEDDSLETEVMASGSLTDSQILSDTDPPEATEGGTEIATVTVSTGSLAGIVIISAVVIAQIIFSPAGSGLILKLTRDGTEIFSEDIAIRGNTPNDGGDPHSVFFVDTGYDLSSSVVYDLDAYNYPDPFQDVDVFDVILVAVEIRR